MSAGKDKPIKPQNLSGFPDHLPRQAVQRNEMISKIGQVFESFGYQPLETPILERTEILMGKYGGEGTKQIYRFQDHGDRDVAMRFDHTVPLARVVAQYQSSLPRPFKRYTVGPAFRGERPQAGRYRQFTQMDCDIVGIKSTIADAEIASIMVKVLEALGLDNYILRINSREVIGAFCKDILELTESESSQALRIVDKIDKLGVEKVTQELKCDFEQNQVDEMWQKYEDEKGKNPYAEPPLKLPDEKADKLVELVACKADTNAETLEKMRGLVSESENALKAVDDLTECISWLPAFGVKEDSVTVDPSVIRGLDYYTGTVFETYIAGHENLGSIIGGGRYDGLIGRYMNQDIPAVGTSIGIDRLINCMDELGVSGGKESNTQVIVVFLDEECVTDYLEIANEIRGWGINCEVFPKRAPFGKQVKYALSKSIPLAVIFGGDEKAKSVVNVKALETSEQIEVSRDALKEKLREMLGDTG